MRAGLAAFFEGASGPEHEGHPRAPLGALGRRRLASTVRWHSDPPLDLRGPLRSGAGPDLYYLRNSTAGILGADDFEIDVTASGGADVQVESPSSTKVLAMEGSASYRVRLGATGGSRLVWGPHPLILQQGADFSQQITIMLSGGTVVLADAIAMGRLARGESLRFRRFENLLQVVSRDGETLYEERYVLRPDDDATIEDALGGFGVLASLYVLGPAARDALETLSRLACESSTFAGVSVLPNDAGVVLRLLATNLTPALSLLEEAVRLVDSGWLTDGRMTSPESHPFIRSRSVVDRVESQ